MCHERESSVTTARAETGDELVNAVVDFRIDMIRTADQHDDAPTFLARLLNHLLALLANVLHVGVIGGVSRVAGMTDFAGGNLREMLLENTRQLLRGNTLRWSMPT